MFSLRFHSLVVRPGWGPSATPTIIHHSPVSGSLCPAGHTSLPLWLSLALCVFTASILDGWMACAPACSLSSLLLSFAVARLSLPVMLPFSALMVVVGTLCLYSIDTRWLDDLCSRLLLE
jgi:hypothetical protein